MGVNSAAPFIRTPPFASSSFQFGYLVTTFKVVSRGTEGAVSVEGTFDGLLASILLACVGCLTGQDPNKWRKPLAKFRRQPHFIVWDNSDLITHEVMGGIKDVMLLELVNEGVVNAAECCKEEGS